VRFDGAVLDAAHLERLDPSFAAGPAPAAPLALPRLPPAGLALDAEGCDLEAWERALVRAALARCGGSPVRTAAYLGIGRKALYGLRRRYGLMDGGPDA
jgi:DNA-binding NtrC family response regulator